MSRRREKSSRAAPRATPTDDPRELPVSCVRCHKRAAEVGVGDPEGILIATCRPCVDRLWTIPALALDVERYARAAQRRRRARHGRRDP